MIAVVANLRHVYLFLLAITCAVTVAGSPEARAADDGGRVSAPAAGADRAPPAGGRIALVVGNNNYRDSPLTNPVNDARAMADALTGLGFEVTVLTDATLAQMSEAARTFGDRLQSGDVGLFYYAGHGMQIKGRNFLIPVDADIRREDEVQYKSFDANQMLDKMESARNPTNIVILDACRNNPFARSFRSSSSGLAQMDAPVGTYLSFATAPGRVASDGEGDNGLFTQHLLEAMKTPGLKVEDVFKQVRVRVMQQSEGQQIPWDSSSLTGDFYFLRELDAEAAPDAPMPPVALAAPAAAPAETVKPPEMVKPVAKSSEASTQRTVAKTPPTSKKSVRPARPVRDPAADEAYRKALEARKRGDLKVALEQLEWAAEHGHAAAQHAAGVAYKVGRPPLQQDLAVARKWFARAADQGVPAAQFEFGKALVEGLGGERSCRDGEHWLRKAAQKAHVDAMVQLAWVALRGCDGDKNPAEAARWLRKAADSGSRDAQFSLGVLYFNGDGVSKDPAEARKWLEAAAAQGHPSTKLYLDRLR